MTAATTPPTVFSRLGRILGLTTGPSTEEDLPRVVQKGLPARSISQLARIVSPEAIALIIPRRTLSHRIAKHQPLDARESAGAVYTALLIATAEQVFGDHARAMDWLTSPKTFLDNKAPLDVTDNIPALELARNRLGRIEHGFFA